MPRYTLCPYYKDENKKSISCEDAIRRFDALIQQKPQPQIDMSDLPDTFSAAEDDIPFK